MEGQDASTWHRSTSAMSSRCRYLRCMQNAINVRAGTLRSTQASAVHKLHSSIKRLCSSPDFVTSLLCPLKTPLLVGKEAVSAGLWRGSARPAAVLRAGVRVAGPGRAGAMRERRLLLLLLLPLPLRAAPASRRCRRLPGRGLRVPAPRRGAALPAGGARGPGSRLRAPAA